MWQREAMAHRHSLVAWRRCATVWSLAVTCCVHPVWGAALVRSGGPAVPPSAIGLGAYATPSVRGDGSCGVRVCVRAPPDRLAPPPCPLAGERVASAVCVAAGRCGSTHGNPAPGGPAVCGLGSVANCRCRSVLRVTACLVCCPPPPLAGRVCSRSARGWSWLENRGVWRWCVMRAAIMRSQR